MVATFKISPVHTFQYCRQTRQIQRYRNGIKKSISRFIRGTFVRANVGQENCRIGRLSANGFTNWIFNVEGKKITQGLVTAKRYDFLQIAAAKFYQIMKLGILPYLYTCSSIYLYPFPIWSDQVVSMKVKTHLQLLYERQKKKSITRLTICIYSKMKWDGLSKIEEMEKRRSWFIGWLNSRTTTRCQYCRMNIPDICGWAKTKYIGFMTIQNFSKWSEVLTIELKKSTLKIHHQSFNINKRNFSLSFSVNWRLLQSFW